MAFWSQKEAAEQLAENARRWEFWTGAASSRAVLCEFLGQLQSTKIRGWLQLRNPLDEAYGAPGATCFSRLAQLLLEGGHFLAGGCGPFSCGFFAQEQSELADCL
jgi:hypothetical protein